MTDKVIPIPAALDGREWEIRNSGDPKIAYVELSKREIVVPFSKGKTEEFVRAHEAMHIAITPYNLRYSINADVEERTIQAVEDCRVNAALRASGIDTEVKRWNDADLLAYSMASPLEMARALLAMRGSQDGEILREIADPKIVEKADAIYNEYFRPFEAKGEIAPWENTVAACEALTAAFSPSSMKPEPTPEEKEKTTKSDSGVPVSGSPVGGESDEDSDEESDPESEDEKEDDKEDDKPKKEKKVADGDFRPSATAETRVEKLPEMTKAEAEAVKASGVKIDYGTGVETPGELTIERPVLTAPFHPKKDRSTRAADMGDIPRSIHRLPVDQRVFREKVRRRHDVAVLIDCSGSMALHDSDVEFILDECPSAIVAIYAGDRSKGTLRVIAEHKQMLADRPFNKGMGYSNVVDVPALQWLADRKEKKKLWISDGYITGRSDHPLGARYYREAAEHIKRGRIIRVNHLQDLKKSHLLRYKEGEFGAYDPPKQITVHGYDLNGKGCAVCDEPNCTWWQEYKREYMQAIREGWSDEQIRDSIYAG